MDIYSPNHVEFLSIFHQNIERLSQQQVEFDPAQIEKYSASLLKSGIGPTGNGTVVIRCAENGSFVMSRECPGRWFPAFYHAGNNPNEVADATGAGNAFLGAFTVRFGETGDVTEATIFGSVAASFVVEQVGMPGLTRKNRGSSLDGDEEEMEMWNGIRFLDRVEEYRDML